jgi:hypothetical protein
MLGRSRRHTGGWAWGGEWPGACEEEVASFGEQNHVERRWAGSGVF